MGATREVLFKGIENGLNQPIAPLIPSGQSSCLPLTVHLTQSAQRSNAIGQASAAHTGRSRASIYKDMGVGAANTGKVMK